VKAYQIGKKNLVRYVRGNDLYGFNEFENNGDATISDHATGLMWAMFDSGMGMNWLEALVYSRQNIAGYFDWRVPTIKELHSIVDYTNGQGKAAIDESVFVISQVEDPEGEA